MSLVPRNKDARPAVMDRCVRSCPLARHVFSGAVRIAADALSRHRARNCVG